MNRQIAFLTLFLSSVSDAKFPDNLTKLTLSINDQQQTLLLNEEQQVLSQPNWQSIANASYMPQWMGKVTTTEGKKGYINAQGELVIKPQFDEARAFTEENIARVKLNDKWGFIRPDGTWFTKPDFYKVKPFVNGFAVVQKEKSGDFYYLNKQGQKAFGQTFVNACDFARNGLACFGEGKSTPVFRVTPSKTTKIMMTTDIKWGYINQTGKVLIPATYESAAGFNPFNIARVTNHKGQMLLIDQNGKKVTDKTFDAIYEFSENGYAEARSENFEGLIDTKGNPVKKADVHELSSEISGLRFNRNKGQFITPDGKPISDKYLSWAQNFNDADVTIARFKKQWGIFTRGGDFKPFPKDIAAPMVDADGYINGFVTGFIAMQDRQGNLVYFNKKGEASYRFAPNKKGIMTLTDKTGKTIWQSTAKNSRYHSILVVDKSQFMDFSSDQVYQTVEKLLQAKPQKFHIPNYIYDNEDNDPYQAPDDYDYDSYTGAIEVVARKYVDEETWGSFDFLNDTDLDAFSQMYQTLVTTLEKRYGKASASDSSYQQWLIEGKVLTARLYNEMGDGDYYHQLVLTVTDKSEEE